VFSNQAHSFQVQARLAIRLSWVGGYINALTLLLCGRATSHVTGSVTTIGIDFAQGKFDELFFLLALVLTFSLGAMLSGLLTEYGRARYWASIYVLPMTVQAVLLSLAAILTKLHLLGGQDNPDLAHLMATLVPALAMGLQNGTITRISGGVVRTTHVSGVMTDIGLNAAALLLRRLGKREFAELRQRQLGIEASQTAPGAASRLQLLSCVAGSFLVGAVLGTYADLEFPDWAFVPAVVFLIFLIVVDIRTPMGRLRTHRELGGTLDEKLPRGVQIFHLCPNRRDGIRTGRLPNMTAWIDDLPPNTHTVVLDIEEMDITDINDMLELRAGAVKLKAAHVQMILCGVTDSERALIRTVGLNNLIQEERILGSIGEVVGVIAKSVN